MKKYLLVILYLFSIIMSTEDLGGETPEQNGTYLAERLDNQLQPKDSKSDISMTLISIKKNREKTSKMLSITKDDGNKMLLFFKSPKKDRGVGFLKIESDKNDKLFLFIPGLNKPRRISSNNQSDSFMNSDLSYEDMLSRDLDEFDYRLLVSIDTLFYILESLFCYFYSFFKNIYIYLW